MAGAAAGQTEEEAPVVMALVDSSIVIDMLRSYPPAIAWLHAQTDTLGVTRFVWHEVIEGCPNKRKQREATRVLDKFELVAVTNADIEWATTALLQNYLKLNTGVYDCLIASTAYRLQIPLLTRNLKHFQPLLANLAMNPY
jgi:predicted nucleic acid-binding protein